MRLMSKPRRRPERSSSEPEERASSAPPPELERHNVVLKDGRYLVAYSYTRRDRDA